MRKSWDFLLILVVVITFFGSESVVSATISFLIAFSILPKSVVIDSVRYVLFFGILNSFLCIYCKMQALNYFSRG